MPKKPMHKQHDGDGLSFDYIIKITLAHLGCSLFGFLSNTLLTWQNKDLHKRHESKRVNINGLMQPQDVGIAAENKKQIVIRKVK